MLPLSLPGIHCLLKVAAIFYSVLYAITNVIECKDLQPANIGEDRCACNLVLLDTSLMDVAIACWDAKYLYFNLRPYQMDNRIKTVAGLPNFPSYTSWHSTFSGAAATVLGHLLKPNASAYETMALEASWSRMYGDIHFRSCEQGLACGKRVGSFSMERAKNDGAGE